MGKRVGVIVEFKEFLEDEVAIRLRKGINGKFMEEGVNWAIESTGFSNDPPEGEAEPGGFLAVIEVRRNEIGKGSGSGFGAVKSIEDAISIGAKHLGEHPGEVLNLIVIGGGSGRKIHGAGDSQHLLEGFGLKNSGGVDAREIDGGCGCNRRGGGGIHGGCSSLKQIDKQLVGRPERWV